jgi:hypothetical protein
VQVIDIPDSFDLVSMLSAEMLDALDSWLQTIKEKAAPFGGATVILIGDLCQLPPVSANWIFTASCWSRFKCHELRENMRQGGEGSYVEMLREVRMGRISVETDQMLKDRVTPPPQDLILVVHLMAT